MGSKEYFEQVADDWDDMREGFFSTSIRDKSIKTSKLKRGEGVVVADVGAGTGFMAESLIGYAAKILAIDESPAMLEIMKKKFVGQTTIEYLQGEVECLPVESESIDCVFANMVLHHVENPAIAIRELFRILKNGGRIVITDLDEHNHDYLRKEHNDRWLGFNRKDVSLWFNNAGFKDVVVDCAGESCSSTSCNGNEDADISIFIASGKK